MRFSIRDVAAACIGVALVVLAGGLAASQAGQGGRGGSTFREPDPIDFADHTGFESIFDGATLGGWDGDRSVWRVEDGAIVGEYTREQSGQNSYISFHGGAERGVFRDFDLKLEIKVENGGGSGIQYRSQVGLPWRRAAPDDPSINLAWMMTGPQADFWYPVSPRAHVYTGQFYSENTPAGIIAWRGQVVNSAPGAAPRLVGTIGDRSALGGYVRINDWNQYLVVARGGTFLHVINGQLMAVFVDDDRASVHNTAGLFGIEIEGKPCRVSVRDIWVKTLAS